MNRAVQRGECGKQRIGQRELSVRNIGRPFLRYYALTRSANFDFGRRQLDLSGQGSSLSRTLMSYRAAVEMQRRWWLRELDRGHL
jgi:hypothetical protein